MAQESSINPDLGIQEQQLYQQDSLPGAIFRFVINTQTQHSADVNQLNQAISALQTSLTPFSSKDENLSANLTTIQNELTIQTTIQSKSYPQLKQLITKVLLASPTIPLDKSLTDINPAQIAISAEALDNLNISLKEQELLQTNTIQAAVFHLIITNQIIHQQITNLTHQNIIDTSPTLEQAKEQFKLISDHNYILKHGADADQLMQLAAEIENLPHELEQLKIEQEAQQTIINHHISLRKQLRQALTTTPIPLLSFEKTTTPDIPSELETVSQTVKEVITHGGLEPRLAPTPEAVRQFTHPASVDRIFTSWQDVFTNCPKEQKSIETYKRLLRKIAGKLPQYLVAKPSGRSDFLLILQNLENITAEELNQVFPKTSQPLSTARVLALIHRLYHNQFLPPENFMQIAQIIRTNQYLDKLQPAKDGLGVQLSSILTEYSDFLTLSTQSESPSPPPEPEKDKNHRFPTTDDEIIEAMTKAIDNFVTTVEAKRIKIDWPITCSQLNSIIGKLSPTTITPILDKQKFIEPFDRKPNDHALLDLLNVVQLIILVEYRQQRGQYRKKEFKKPLQKFAQLLPKAIEQYTKDTKALKKKPPTWLKVKSN